ncbi:MAG TPA: DUF2797 domain-containing protein [Candidatus Thermoplasmatota archaeon]|nr:DUF2797 domain-containing protein [Candidatus Thermoplasmatota archaeon]
MRLHIVGQVEHPSPPSRAALDGGAGQSLAAGPPLPCAEPAAVLLAVAETAAPPDPAEGPLPEGLTAVPLRGSFAWRIEGMRTCVGRIEQGTHKPCPQARMVTQDAQCASCCGLESPECVFEPRCQLDPSACTCVSSFKGVEHLVYAAFYGTLPKVGMTQAWRVERRLREQGADAYFTIQRGLDRPTARQTERAVSLLYRVPENRSHREVLPMLARPVPWDIVERRADELRLRLESSYAVERALHRIEDHPVRQPLPGIPRRAPTHGVHVGTWLGAKGNHVFYREAPRAGRLVVGSAPIVGLKRSDLLGRHIVVEPGTPRERP